MPVELILNKTIWEQHLSYMAIIIIIIIICGGRRSYAESFCGEPSSDLFLQS